MESSRINRVIELVKSRGVLRPVELDEYGIPREYLILLHRRGILERIGRGLYIISTHEATEHHTMAAISKRVPHGIICLLSALQFHMLTTQLPSQLWMAIQHKDRAPKTRLPLKIVYMKERAFSAGIVKHVIEGVNVKIYCPAKTVVDCFKFRNRIGLDVAIEALRDCRRKRKCTSDELWRYAGICRQTEVMRPYLTMVE